jgi:hypothetical protein
VNILTKFTSTYEKATSIASSLVGLNGASFRPILSVCSAEELSTKAAIIKLIAKQYFYRLLIFDGQSEILYFGRYLLQNDVRSCEIEQIDAQQGEQAADVL